MVNLWLNVTVIAYFADDVRNIHVFLCDFYIIMQYPCWSLVTIVKCMRTYVCLQNLVCQLSRLIMEYTCAYELYQQTIMCNVTAFF